MLKRRFGSKAGNAQIGRGGAGSSNRAGENDEASGDLKSDRSSYAAGGIDQPEDSAEAVDRYERSSERTGASSKRSGFMSGKKARAGAKSFASARRVSEAADEHVAGSSAGPIEQRKQSDSINRDDLHGQSAASPTREQDDRGSHDDHASAQPAQPDRAARLQQARSLLQQATAQAVGPPPRVQPTAVSTGQFDDPFEEADPFESFEQCAPSRAPAVETGTVSERPIRRPRKARSATNRPSPQRLPADDAFEDSEPFEQCAPQAEVELESAYSRSSERQRKVPNANNPRQPQRSLKGRALGYLSRREYSRAELSRKLRPYVEEADSLETLLDSLERDGWLSNERFVESVVHRRAARMGGSRIIIELKRHAVGDALIGETAGKLAVTETARAQAVWERKYGVLPETPAERAKQARFLAARGFSGSTIGKILKGGDEDCADEFIDD
ncbi:recombination protein RecX [Caballeronia grimmiae]|uniref:Regulatory protein RecX n=1 Tax=Caballeronia grimmiae TaxID=1071679 RepID=A0A069PFD2_9BURK|nr:recombination protein RecX [Caballeronia grimmiae]GGD57622.1 hypothetical protein GCM10010985_09400 [Caballeronia grimmiae]